MGLEQYSKAVKETAQNLRIIDDALFRLVAEQKLVCQEILRTLLDIPEVTIVYITEYDALGNGQIFTHVKRCMETGEGYVPVRDREDIYFANTALQDESDRSHLLQLFLRKDAFEDKAYPELSRAVKYFKTTEGGYEKVCKTVEDYAKVFAKDYGRQCRIEGQREERKNLISGMLSSGKTPEEIAAFTGIALEEVEAVKEALCAGVQQMPIF